MMSNTKLTPEEERILWLQARRNLEEIKIDRINSYQLVDRLKAQLPAKKTNETVGDLIRRASAPPEPMVDILPFRPKSTRRFEPLSEFVRLAADTGESEIPLPVPDVALESTDGRFRLRVAVQDTRIELFVEALGLAADQFAGCHIGLADPADDNAPIAEMTLDQDGDGSCQMEDTPQVRRALLNPVFLLVK